MDSTRNDCKPVAVLPEDSASLLSEVLPSAEVIENVPLPDADIGAGGPSAEVLGTMRRDEPSSSQPADVPISSTGERGKGLAEDGCETGSNLDPNEVRILSEGFTCFEVRLEGSSRTIVVPMDRDLLLNTEGVVPSLGPIFSDVEGRTLETLDGVALSMGIADLTLRVSFLTFLVSVVSMPCALFLFFCLTLVFFSSFFLDHYLGDRDCSSEGEA